MIIIFWLMISNYISMLKKELMNVSKIHQNGLKNACTILFALANLVVIEQ